MRSPFNYQIIEPGVIKCQACSHFCKIKEGKTGICGVRQNNKGKLKLLVYGKAIAVNIDPIEKKPLFHFLPGSQAYSFGTLGCNFRCDNCQNFDISQIYNFKGKTEKYKKFSWGYNLPPREIVEDALASKCQSIAYTYNEPTVFLEYALDTMQLARKKGLKNIWVSNGFMSKKTAALILPYLDAINIDLKSFDDNFYKKHCGGRLNPILRNCRTFVKNKVWLEITTLIIPTLSDNRKTFEEIARFIKKELGDFVPWHISGFSPKISWKLQDLPETPLGKIKEAYQIGKKMGLKYVYGGNVWQEDLENTFCPKCKKATIRRKGYRINCQLRGSCCPFCQEKIEGIFDS